MTFLRRDSQACGALKRTRLQVELLEERNLLDAASIVTGFYNVMLHRQPDPGGMAGWVSLLNSGGTPYQVALGIANSYEATVDKVTDYYNQILGRDPDIAGLNGWVSVFQSGSNSQQVLANFLASDEFFHNSGGTNDGFLHALYNAVLDRDIDPIGLAGWGSALAAGSSRYSVAKGVVSSYEADQNFMIGLFHEFLGRDPDQTSLNVGISVLQSGGDDIANVAEATYAAQAATANISLQAGVPSTPGIYLESHVVTLGFIPTGKEHTFLLVVQPDMTYFTIGAGPALDVATLLTPQLGLKLAAAYNRSHDVADPVDFRIQLSTVTPLTQAIQQLITIASSSCNSEPYYFIPGNSSEHNSNSFVAGLLQAAGIMVPPTITGKIGQVVNLKNNSSLFPGITIPLPQTDFQCPNMLKPPTAIPITQPIPAPPPPTNMPFDPDNDGDDDTGQTGY